MTQLRRLGYAPETPADLVESWLDRAPIALSHNHYFAICFKRYAQ